MTLLEQLKTACTTKGIEFLEQDSMFGITLKPGIWHWFKHHKENIFVFDHTYSQNTGFTKKGILHGIGVRSYVKHKTGVDI